MALSRSPFRGSVSFPVADWSSSLLESNAGLSACVFTSSVSLLLGDGEREADFHGFRAKLDKESETDLTFIPRSDLSSMAAAFGGLYEVSSGLRSIESVNFDMVIFG